MPETQNEVGGKSLLLKLGKAISATSVSASATLTSTAHGLAVGDLVKPVTRGSNTVISIGTLYFVKTVPTADTFTISATPTGSAITLDDSESDMSFIGFYPVGGLRSKTFSFKANGIVITNHDSDEFEKILDEAGVRSMSISGAGVFSNDTNRNLVESNCVSNLLTRFAFVNIKHGRIYEGLFKIKSFDASGDYNAEGKFSMACDSSGSVTLQAAA